MKIIIETDNFKNIDLTITDNEGNKLLAKKDIQNDTNSTKVFSVEFLAKQIVEQASKLDNF